MRMTQNELAGIIAKPGYLVSADLHRKTPDPVLERNSRPGTLGKSQAKKTDTRRFLVRVKSFRRRLLDQDNLCEKFAVDCCRYAGLLPADDPGKAKIEVSQEKVKRKEDERTEITIEIIQ